MKKALFVLFCALTVMALPLSAQTRALLTIDCNETGASVFINGRLAGYTNPQFSQSLSSAVYSIKVEKTGFVSFESQVRMSGRNLVIPVKLVPEGGQTGGERRLEPPRVIGQPAPERPFNYTIRSNVNGADVSIDGRLVGKTPLVLELKSGSYDLAISAPGYVSQRQRINIKETGTYTVNLVPEKVSFSIRSNVQGAEVLINGTSVGRTPFRSELNKGTFQVTVRAPGYVNYEAQHALSENQTIDINLVPAKASLTVVVPVNLLDRTNRRDRVQLLVDNVPQTGLSAELDPGRRTIKLVSGALVIENTLIVEAGKSYSLELNASLLIR